MNIFLGKVEKYVKLTKAGCIFLFRLFFYRKNIDVFTYLPKPKNIMLLRLRNVRTALLFP